LPVLRKSHQLFCFETQALKPICLKVVSGSKVTDSKYSEAIAQHMSQRLKTNWSPWPIG
jgi:hypothetical protein